MTAPVPVDTVQAFRARLAEPCGVPHSAGSAPWVRFPPTAEDQAKLEAFRARITKPWGVPLGDADVMAGATDQAAVANLQG